jgi:hypothetical protein
MMDVGELSNLSKRYERNEAENQCDRDKQRDIHIHMSAKNLS